MKLRKLTAAALAAVLCLGGPAASAAGSADAELTRVTQAVKAVLSIPDGYDKFYGEPRETHLGTFWELSWSGEAGELSVSASNEGKVLSMYRSDNTTPVNPSGQSGPHFPALDRAQAQAKAQAFLDRVLTAGETAVFSENSSTPSLSSAHRNFRGEIRLNGLPSPLGFSIRVRLTDGEVMSFSREDTSYYAGSLPAAVSSISRADAAAKLKTVFTMRLEYVRDKDTEKAVLRYLPEDRHEFYVDAASGELVDLTLLREELWKEGAVSGGSENDMATAESAAPAAEAPEASLSREELEGIAKLEGVLSADELDRKARAWSELGLDGYERSAANFSIDREDDTVTVRLAYAKKDGEDISRRNVTLDAKTGDLLSVYGYRPYDPDATAKLTQEAAQAKAEAFLKALWPGQLTKTELYRADPAAEKGDPTFSFVFAQKANGYFFPENSLNVRIDGMDGTVLGLNRTFDEDIALDSPEGLVSMDAAVDAWAAGYPMELSYIAVPVRLDLLGDEVLPLLNAGYRYFDALKPGYGLSWGENGYDGVDAKTGKLVPWERHTPDAVTYGDLSGHWARTALEELAEYRVGWLGGKARPDAALTQLDLIALLASADGYLYNPSEEGAADDLYQYAYRQGLLTKAERNDTRKVNRLELVKLLLDSLGYKTAANLRGIYRCDFTDAGALTGSALGYAALAQGLGMVSGDSTGRFAPDRAATRAEAAVMLWQYLRR